MRQLSVLFLAGSLQPAPLQAQVSWPALQAVALCFLPVAGGSLSSFGTGLARFLAAGLASFGAAASFGSGSFGSVAGRPAACQSCWLSQPCTCPAEAMGVNLNKDLFRKKLCNLTTNHFHHQTKVKPKKQVLPLATCRSPGRRQTNWHFGQPRQLGQLEQLPAQLFPQSPSV